MKPTTTFFGITLFCALLMSGCTKSKPKAPEAQPDSSSTTTAPAETGENKEGGGAAGQAEKIMGDDMYLERARNQLKPENMEAELNRIEKDLDKLERKIERGEAAIEQGMVEKAETP